MKRQLLYLALSLIFSFEIVHCQIVRMPLKKNHQKESDPERTFLNFNARMDINNLRNSQYTGTLQIGSNGKSFEVVLDTGSANLWVPDASISGQFTNSFDCSRSTTCQASLAERYPLSYGTGNIVGYKATDQLQLGGLSIPEFNMLLAYIVEDMPRGNFDGILGLSLGRYLPEFPTLLEILQESGQIQNGTFSMYLGDDPSSYGGSTGEIIFGGYDPKYAASEFQFVKVFSPSKTLFWAANMEAIAYGYNQNMSISNFPAVFDSGTSLLLLPQSFIDNFLEKAAAQGVSFKLDLSSNLYMCSCDAQDVLDDLVFYFDGVTLSVPASSYLVSQYGGCFLGIQPQKGRVSLSNPAILGDILLKNYYTLYTADNSTVGFAQAVPIKHFPIWLIFVIILSVALVIFIGYCLWNRRKQARTNDSFVSFRSKGIVIGSSNNHELRSQLLNNQQGFAAEDAQRNPANYPLSLSYGGSVERNRDNLQY